MPTQSSEVDFRKNWVSAYNPSRIANTSVRTTRQIYLVPFEVSGIHLFDSASFRFKFTWVASGPAPSFNFYNAVYRVERGQGGTASTLVKCFDIGSITRTGGVTGTEYVNLVQTAITANNYLKEGVYCVAFLWVDTSVIPSRETFIASGNTLAVAGGWFNLIATGGVTTLPATITAFTGSDNFSIYFESLN